MSQPISRTVGSQAASTPILLNHQGPNPFSVTLLATVTGTLTYTVQFTLDDVFAPNYNPATGVWNTVTGMGAQTTTVAAALSSPVTAVRINVSAYTSGSVVLTAMQQT